MGSWDPFSILVEWRGGRGNGSAVLSFRKFSPVL